MSKKYSLNKKDLGKIGKGLGIALGGVALVYVAEILPMIEFGEWSGLVVALSAVLINLGRKYLSE